MLEPTKIVQHRSNFLPYITDEICELGHQVKVKFNHAVSTGHDYDWDDHNNSKSIYQKAFNLAKKQYLAASLRGTKKILNYIKTISNIVTQFVFQQSVLR